MNRNVIGLFGGIVFAATTAQGDVVALNGYFYDAPTVIQNGGHTVLTNINLNVPIQGVDCLWLDRGTAPNLNNTETQNVLNFLNGGGKVMTEYSGTDVWFNGKFASFQGTPNGFASPGDLGVCGGNDVYSTPPNDDFNVGLPNPFYSADPIGALNVYSNLDAAIHVPLRIQNDPNYGDIPIVGCANVGQGIAVMFFSDFADFNQCGGPETSEEILLLNAIVADCVPAPGAAAVLGLAGLMAARRRR